MTGKEKPELYDHYEQAIGGMGINIMQTRIPQSVKYDREQSITGNDFLFLSTIFPPDKQLLKGSNWDTFMDEMIKLINVK
jgi:hypothetical protein